MATIRKNVPWSFLTNLTPVATDTTFGTTTTYTFPAINIELETSRVVKSAWLEFSVDTASTAAADVDGIECGIEVNGGGVTSTQYTMTFADTGENERLVICHDVTADLIAGLDPGETQSIEASISVVTESAQNVNGHTCTLWIEYECANDGATYYTYVDIMIQSHHSIIADTFVEIGTTGATGGADAPVNQIPQLTGVGGLLSDSGIGFVAIHQLKLHLFCRAGDNTTTDQTLRLSLDAGSTENSRAVNEQALGHRVEYWDIVDLAGGDTNMTLTTTASAALHAANTTATNGFEGLGGFLRVVVEINPATATHELHNLRMAMSDFDNGTFANTTIVDGSTMWCDLHIDEPGPIVMLRSGFVILAQNAQNQNAQNSFMARGQINTNNGLDTQARLWLTQNALSAGQRYWFQRADIAWSTWSLGRGRNRLHVDYTLQNPAMTPTIMAMVTYLSGIPTAGLGVGNHTVGRMVADWSEANGSSPDVDSSMLHLFADPLITAGAPWCVSNVMVSQHGRSSFNQFVIPFALEFNPGEAGGRKFVGTALDGISLSIAEQQHLEFCLEITHWFHTRGRGEAPLVYRAAEKMDLFADRRVSRPSNLGRQTFSLMWVTYHCVATNVDITYEVAGSPVNGAGKVRLTAARPGSPQDFETVAAPADITLASGAATVQVADSTVPYQAIGLDAAGGSSAILWPTSAGETPRIVDRGDIFFASSSGNDAPMPYDQQPYDVLVLVLATDRGEAVNVVDDRGWVFETPQVPPGAGATSLMLAWYRIAEDEPLPVQSPDLGVHVDYIAGFCYTVRGCKRSGNPFSVIQGATAATNTAVALPSVTTPVANCLVAGHLAQGLDNATPRTLPEAWSCSTLLGGCREYGASQTSSVDGGGCLVVAGIKETAGATGTIDGTLFTTSEQAMITVAFEPEAPSTGTLAIEISAGGTSVPTVSGPRIVQDNVLRKYGA